MLAVTLADAGSLAGELATLAVFLVGCWSLGRGLWSLVFGRGQPRPRPRPLPTVHSRPRAPERVNTVNIHPPQLVVAGRTYQVTEDEDPPPETCPWCLGSLDGEPPDEIVRCEQPYCGRAAHRRHNLEHGGCGGICSVVRA